MTEFKLDPRLANDCFEIAENDLNFVLLMNNSAVPWFIIVPKVSVIEWTDLPEHQERQLKADIDVLATYIKEHFSIDKLNIAGIGNVVSQLHIHVIGRSKTDYCWPNVVWGTSAPSSYEQVRVDEITQQLLSFTGDQFSALKSE